MFCRKCGLPIDNQQTICACCGTPVKSINNMNSTNNQNVNNMIGAVQEINNSNIPNIPSALNEGNFNIKQNDAQSEAVTNNVMNVLEPSNVILASSIYTSKGYWIHRNAKINFLNCWNGFPGNMS